MPEDFVLEIGCEEIPASFLPGMISDLESKGRAMFEDARLSFEQVRATGSPRRLILIGKGVADVQPDSVERARGPSKAAAFDREGRPTRAAEGFARSRGVSVSDLVVEDSPQGAYVYSVMVKPGLSAPDALSARLPSLITSLDLPKGMRWGEGDLRFVRPIRWILALFGGEVVRFEVGEALSSGRWSRGLRSVRPDPVEVPSAASYIESLRRSFVIADHLERKELIRRQVEEAARGEGGVVLLDEELLDQVTFLVEHPTAFAGAFEEDFLSLPDDVLITVMRHHQRYFPVVAPGGARKLLPRFVAVRNGTADSIEVVRSGNERVLKARLADAKFFFDEDMRTHLEARVEELKGMVFHKDLGSMYEKTRRLERLVSLLSPVAGLSTEDAQVAVKAAGLCKADLVTLMVGELPELQGDMGREYLVAQGADPRVALAVGEHYMPRSAGGGLPSSRAGALLSIADRADSIAGYALAGIRPTGSQDPYGMRRLAAGVVRIVLEADVDLDLEQLVSAAVEGYGGGREARDARREAEQILWQRCRIWLAENGYAPDVIDAVLAKESRSAKRAVKKSRALSAVLRGPAGEDLMTAWRRSAHLARSAQNSAVRPELFSEEAESSLFHAVREAAAKAGERLKREDYEGYLTVLCGLRGPVDRFLDGVLVMSEDESVRRNRLALLKMTSDLLEGEYALDVMKSG